MKVIYFVLTLLLVCLPGLAQTSAKNDELKFDADYFLMRKEFDKALALYLKVLRSETNNADIKHRIGICYLNSEEEKNKAIPYLEEAVKKISVRYSINSFKETNAPIEAYFLLGSAYRVNNNLDEAIAAYEKYKEFLDPKDKYNLKVTDQYINNCKLAREMMKEPRRVTFSNLGKEININQPNFNAVISGDGKTLAFTSPGRLGFSIYLCTFADTAWSAPKDITSVLGTGKYMKTCSLSWDGTTMLLVQEDPDNSDLYISHFKKGRWSKAAALNKPINSKWNETSASLSPDGKTMYFTSARNGGEGDLDIYRSFLVGEEWTKPENLGPKINTPYNEETPFLAPDGHMLYFSSEGHTGIGGYDIYRYDFSHPEEGVVNLGYPINTTDNNVYYIPTGDGSTALYAFRNPESGGERNIYLVKFPPEAKEEALMATLPVPPEEVKKDTLIANISVEPEPKEETPQTELNPALNATIAPVKKDTLSGFGGLAINSEISSEAEPEKEETVKIPDHAEVSPGEAKSYSVQFMALRKPVDLTYFHGLSDIEVGYCPDAWYRYAWMTTTDSLRAREILQNLVNKGYTDAFIRRKSIVPRYTVQVMAVPGPVTDLTRFSDLPEIWVTKGIDKFCRYTTGEFGSREEALSALKQIKMLGYKRAFVRKVRILR